MAIKFEFKNADFRYLVRMSFANYIKLYKNKFLYPLTTEEALKIILIMSEKTFLPLKSVEDLEEKYKNIDGKKYYWFVDNKELKKSNFKKLEEKYKVIKNDVSLDLILYTYISYMIKTF